MRPGDASGSGTIPPGALTPATGSRTTASRMNLALRPLGEVEYDGQTLPVVDPTGRWLAVQMGAPPTPEEVLGLSARVPSDCGVALYRVPTVAEMGANPRAALERVEVAGDVSGLVLGRGATLEGVLVEQTQPGGGRWVGQLDFESHRVRWLIQGEDVNAQAVMAPDGSLLWCRRTGERGAFALMARASGGEDRAVELPVPGSALQPMLAPDGQHGGVLVSGGSGLTLVLLERDERGAWRSGGRVALGRGGAGDAWSALAPVESMPSAGPAGGAGVLESSVMLLHPMQQRVCAVHARTGAMVLLPAGSISASRVGLDGRGGLAVTQEAALSWIACGSGPGGGGLALGERAALMNGPMVARSVEGSEGRLILIGPGRGGGPARLSVAFAQILPRDGGVPKVE